MPRFFVDADQICDGYISITGDDAHHISRSLRMAAGEHVTVSDMRGNEYDCVLEKFLDGCVRARIDVSRISDAEPKFRAHLYQAIPKGDKLDSIIQKSVECGVFSVTTFESERCIVKESVTDEKRLLRRQRIALEAAKQSRRGIVPQIYPTISYKQMLDEASRSDIRLFCYEGEGTQPLGHVLKGVSSALRARTGCTPCGDEPVSISVVIGSEGGFSPLEAKTALDRGFSLVGLGKRILRTETASAFVLSCIVYESEL